jgi:hypothetical protein
MAVACFSHGKVVAEYTDRIIPTVLGELPWHCTQVGIFPVFQESRAASPPAILR